nr:MAG TPA: hypothetical protein [Caudoviricetes sp.]
MIKYLTVPTLKFDRGKLSSKEIDKRVRFASKKQYSVWGDKVIARDPYTKRALATQALMAEMQKYPYAMLVSFINDYKAGGYGVYEKYPQGLRNILSMCMYRVADYEYALSILPVKYRRDRTE